MTCREFKHKAALLSLLQVTQTQDAQIVGHAETCPACGAWLDKQRTLAASMHALRSRTASQEAGPDVERALLRVFRQGISAGVGTSPSAVKAAASSTKLTPVGMTEPGKTARPIAAPVSTPFAWRLSRLFEAGAYVAVAAAVVVAVFLGVQLLRQGSGPAPLRSHSSPEKTAPAVQQPVVAGASNDSASNAEQPRAFARRRSSRARTEAAQKSESTVAQAANDEAQSVADTGYTPLMFCDPLSCSGDAQVVRMELPPSPSAGQGAAPQIADVVVGYDGVVRAVRLEN